jgi:phosphoglucomutase
MEKSEDNEDNMTAQLIPSTPFFDQRPGTAGLRKKVTTMQQPHYLANFVQSIFNCAPELRGNTLVIGGDGRYWNREAITTCLQMAAANGISRVLVGQGGILSTPAASNLIRQRGAAGGLVLTASHNPAGPDGDFGIKYNIAGGGQAPEALTDRIFEASRTLTQYRIDPSLHADIDQVGTSTTGDFTVEVIDGVSDYASQMAELFDFDLIRNWLKQGHRIRFDALHAVTGPYARRILVEQLGAAEADIVNATPLEDFGGGHPDPNLIYAAELVAHMNGHNAADLGAASDGDGDRNMILGPGVFVSPGDSLAMLADNLHLCPGYADGVVGIARSMPTCRAADHVARQRNIDLYETPTGWKFFCNLLDAGKITVCGEESFGTGSTHVREKDGLWAVLAWANILAASGRSLPDIARSHWQRYGRHYFQRHDYEGLEANLADAIVSDLRARLPELLGQTMGELTVTAADDFAYTDPIDNSQAHGQGLRVVMGDTARIVLRKSGTGTDGATLRLYLEHWRQDALDLDPAAALAPLAALADTLIGLRQRTGRAEPDVVT